MNELSTTFETVKGKEVHLFLNVNHDSYFDPVLFYSLIFTILFSVFIFWVRSIEKRVNTLIINYNLVREKILNIEEKNKNYIKEEELNNNDYEFKKQLLND